METYFSFLTNRASLGEEFPATLHDAWRVASGLVVSHVWKEDTLGDMLSVFTLADDRTDSSASRSISGSFVRGGGGRGGASAGRGSVYAGRDCVSAERGMIAQGGGRCNSNRTCCFCLKKGHLQRDCPDNDLEEKKAVMIAVGEDDAVG
jgi:hypothetical protein